MRIRQAMVGRRCTPSTHTHTRQVMHSQWRSSCVKYVEDFPTCAESFEWRRFRLQPEKYYIGISEWLTLCFYVLVATIACIKKKTVIWISLVNLASWWRQTHFPCNKRELSHMRHFSHDSQFFLLLFSFFLTSPESHFSLAGVASSTERAVWHENHDDPYPSQFHSQTTKCRMLGFICNAKIIFLSKCTMHILQYENCMVPWTTRAACRAAGCQRHMKRWQHYDMDGRIIVCQPWNYIFLLWPFECVRCVWAQCAPPQMQCSFQLAIAIVCNRRHCGVPHRWNKRIYNKKEYEKRILCDFWCYLPLFVGAFLDDERGWWDGSWHGIAKNFNLCELALFVDIRDFCTSFHDFGQSNVLTRVQLIQCKY